MRPAAPTRSSPGARAHSLSQWAADRAQGLVRLLHRVIPKRNQAVLYGWPDFEDTVLALEPLLQDGPLNRVVMLVDGVDGPRPPLGPRTVVLAKRSVRGFVAFLRSRYVLFTHKCYVREFPPSVVSVNIWHGMPVKLIGPAQSGWKPVRAQFALATSEFWSDMVAEAHQPTERVLINGLPRTDRMGCDRDRVQSAVLDGDPGPLLVWLPTFRSPVRIVTGTDGAPAGNVFEMPEMDPQRLERLLARWSATLLVKPHPMAHSPGFQDLGHIKVIDDDWLRERAVSLYEVLGASDLLISDVSSVTVDYLVLDRPIIHAMPDHREYGATRGFSLTPLADYLMGTLVEDFDGLLRAVEGELAGLDPARAQRRRMIELMQADVSFSAAPRLLAEIGLGSPPRDTGGAG